MEEREDKSAPDRKRGAEFIKNRRLPVVGQREVVPVRLVPLITLEELGHKLFAGILSNKLRIDGFPHDAECDPPHRDNGVSAYYLDDQGKPVRMRPAAWGIFYHDLSVLTKLMRKQEKVNGVIDSLHRAWRLEATKTLPPGVFLWRDDLEELWKTHVACFALWEGEPEDFRVMNYDVFILPEYQDLVFEGFEHLWETLTPPIQTDEPGGSNVSDPVPPSSPAPNESPAPCVSPNSEPEPSGDPGRTKNVTNMGKPPNGGGRHPKPLREALEYVFLLCRTSTDSSRREAIAVGNRDKLMNLLHELLGGGDKAKLDTYVAARIAKVYLGKKEKGIKTCTIKKGELLRRGTKFDSHDITKVLGSIRTKYKNFSDNDLSEAFEDIKKDSHP